MAWIFKQYHNKQYSVSLCHTRIGNYMRLLHFSNGNAIFRWEGVKKTAGKTKGKIQMTDINRLAALTIWNNQHIRHIKELIED